MLMRAHSPVRSERGFSMFLAIMAMLVTSMFVAAAFAAANGDLPLSAQSKDRKQAYAAAEAGLNFYESRLTQNPDYWTQCDQVPAPNGTEFSPVNLPGASPRRWRNLPSGSTAQYTIDLLPANGAAKCVPGNADTMIDRSTGTFRIRVTGRPSPTSRVKRSLVASFRRDGFLNFLWFTDFEDLDPSAEATQTQIDTYTAKCADKYRDVRSGCDEISFITGDAMKGPMHSNDSFLYCGTPQWGRDANDPIESSAGSPGYYPNGGGCGVPNIKGAFKASADPMKMPPTNSSLLSAAVATGNHVYTGKTIIRFNSNGTMNVTYPDPADSSFTTFKTDSNVPQPPNSVIYVKSGGVCTTKTPRAADYLETNTCGNVYVSGTYTQSMTIAAENDIIVKPTTNNSVSAPKTNDADLVHDANHDAVLGLIANNFVRVAHPCSNDTNVNTTNQPLVKSMKIQAAILSLQHSFILDNHDCGSPLGTLTIEGVIAQKYRGTVSTHSNGVVQSGYLKDYNYDDRLRYRSPPYFLNPVDAAWKVIKVTEQVPAV
jgi:hypothetical protein